MLVLEGITKGDVNGGDRRLKHVMKTVGFL